MKRKPPLTDECPFPFGKHKDTKMKDVPSDYLHWLMEQPWIIDWPQVNQYLALNATRIYKEIDDEQGTYEEGYEGYRDYEDYQRDIR